jgi:hypothetical protein
MTQSDPILNVLNRGLKQPIRDLLSLGHYGAALVVTLTSIDIVSVLGMPEDQDRATKAGFVRWAERYIHLQGDTVISGLEWYGARCGVLHTYSPCSSLGKHSGVRIIGYVDDMVPSVRYRQGNSPDFILVSVRAFVQAFFAGLDKYLIDLYSSPERARLADVRLGKMFHCLQYPDI